MEVSWKILLALVVALIALIAYALALRDKAAFCTCGAAELRTQRSAAALRAKKRAARRKQLAAEADEDDEYD